MNSNKDELDNRFESEKSLLEANISNLSFKLETTLKAKAFFTREHLNMPKAS